MKKLLPLLVVFGLAFSFSFNTVAAMNQCEEEYEKEYEAPYIIIKDIVFMSLFGNEKQKNCVVPQLKEALKDGYGCNFDKIWKAGKYVFLTFVIGGIVYTYKFLL